MFISPTPGQQILSTPYQEQKVNFTGSAAGYFKLWIVNLLCTVLTLGIYSAWAKVRRKKYLYNHTWYNKENFDFTANPLKILKGRIILVAMYAVFIAVSSLNNMVVNLVMISIFTLMAPWIIIKSRQFNLRNTSYCGLRFNFKADYSQALKIVLLYPLLSVATLFILKPFELRKKGKFLIDNSDFAGKHFVFNSENSKFSKIVVISVMLIIIPIILFSAVMAFKVFFAGSNNSAAIIMLGIIPFYLFSIAAGLYFLFACRNEFINNTSFGKLQLHSSASVWYLIWLGFSNLIAVILSLGLLTPWATVRKHKYLVEHLSSHGESELQSLRGQANSHNSALSEETSDFFDMDFGI